MTKNMFASRTTQHLIASTMTALALVGGVQVVFADRGNVPTHGHSQTQNHNDDDGEENEPRSTPRPQGDDDDDDGLPTPVVTPEPTTPPLPPATATAVPTPEPTQAPAPAPKPSDLAPTAPEGNVEEEPISLPTFATVPPVIIFLPAPEAGGPVVTPSPRQDLPANIQLPKTGN